MAFRSAVPENAAAPCKPRAAVVLKGEAKVPKRVLTQCPVLSGKRRGCPARSSARLIVVLPSKWRGPGPQKCSQPSTALRTQRASSPPCPERSVLCISPAVLTLNISHTCIHNAPAQAHMHAYISTRAHTPTCVHEHTHMHTSTGTQVHACAHMDVDTLVCVHVHL